MKVLKTNYKWISENYERLDASFHLSDGRKTKLLIEKSPFKIKLLDEVTKNIFNGPRFKRYYVLSNGIPFMGSSDMLKPDLTSLKQISKTYSNKLDDLFIEKNWILVSCSGTIGNTIFTTDDYDKKTGSQHIMRIIPELSEVKSGFLYSFLSSKYGYALLTQGTYGAVVQHIEPHHIGDIPIPMFPKNKQNKIHELIMEASQKRVEGNQLIKKAIDLFHEFNGIQYKDYQISPLENVKYQGFKHKIGTNSAISFKAKNYSKRVLEIKKMWGSCKGIKLENYLVSPFRIGVRGSFKRIDEEAIGVEMVSQTDLHRINPGNYKRVILKRKNEGDFAKENQVLFPAVGNGSSEGEILFRPTLAYKTFTDKLLSGDIGRFDCESIKHAAYLFAALKSKGGFRMMRAFYYGTQLRRPTWKLLKEINIPIKDNQCFKEISETVIKAFELRFQADQKENKAIQLIENEIESWQS